MEYSSVSETTVTPGNLERSCGTLSSGQAALPFGQGGKQAGQGLTEFALTVPIALLFIVIILEFGFALGAYVNVVWAAREGARLGSLYVFVPNCSADYAINIGYNDSNRASGTNCSVAPYKDNAREVVKRSLGWLNTEPPKFNVGTDVAVTVPPFVDQPPDRTGDMLSVTVSYRYNWLTPLFSSFPITLTGKSESRIE